MAEILGVRAALDLVTPTGVDAGRVWEQTVLAEKVSVGDIISLGAAAVGAANEAIIARYNGIITITDSMFAFDAIGRTSRSMTPQRTEFSAPDAKRSQEVGHMFPLRAYEDACGWTSVWLEKARRQQIANDIDQIVEDWINRVDFEIVKRVLYQTENAEGAGYDVPWARGTGTNVPFIPKQYGSTVFDGTHSHFVTANTSVSGTWTTLISEMVEELRHHGIAGRLVLWVSNSDVEDLSGEANFVELTPSDLIPNTGDTALQKFMATGEYEGLPGQLVGWFKDFRGLVGVFVHERFPAGYAFMTAPNRGGRNALALRVDTNEPFGLRPKPVVDAGLNPRFEELLFEGKFGIAVNNRLLGVAGRIGAGVTSWTNPTIA